MSAAKHTAAVLDQRWFAEGGTIYDENRLTVARVMAQEEDNSDAVLIAAAPDMAEALHSARCALDVFLSGELSDASAVERLASAAVIVTTALAKAGL